MDVSEAEGPVPESHIALNWFADYFARMASKRFDHLVNIASDVLYFISLVQKVQRRLMRVINSVVDKGKYEKQHAVP